MRRETGGPAESLRMLLRGYRTIGHEAEIATLDPATTELEDVAAPVHALGRKRFGYGYSPALATFLRNNASRFDGTIVHGLWQYHGLAALRELGKQHPYAVFPHGMLDPWFNRVYPWKLLKKMPYWLLVERQLLGGAQAVLFTSLAEARLARTSFPGSRWREQVVPYGTFGPTGDPQANRIALAHRIPALGERPFLLFAGRLHEKKGCDLLIRAYAEVSRETSLPSLVIAGPDETGLTPHLQALATQEHLEDKILWPGMLTGAAKWGAFQSAEAFVLPSHQENFGIAVSEALSCGTPVLISDQVNIHREVSASGAGLVEPDTLEGSIRLLRRWAALNETQRREMKLQAVACWRTHFDSAGTSLAIVQLFSELPRA